MQKISTIPHWEQQMLIETLVQNKGYNNLKIVEIQQNKYEKSFHYEAYSGGDMIVRAILNKLTNRIVIDHRYINDKQTTVSYSDIYIVLDGRLIPISSELICPNCGEKLQYYNIQPHISTYSIHNNEPVHINTLNVLDSDIERGLKCNIRETHCDFLYKLNPDGTHKCNKTITEYKKIKIKTTVEALHNALEFQIYK